jgi:type 1 fimbria pilin
MKLILGIVLLLSLVSFAPAAAADDPICSLIWPGDSVDDGACEINAGGTCVDIYWTPLPPRPVIYNC